MKVRLATIEDMPVLLEIYQRARAFMMQAGNPNQWPEGHPSKDDLLEEMRQDRFMCLKVKVSFRQVLYIIKELIHVTRLFMMVNG